MKTRKGSRQGMLSKLVPIAKKTVIKVDDEIEILIREVTEELKETEEFRELFAQMECSESEDISMLKESDNRENACSSDLVSKECLDGNSVKLCKNILQNDEYFEGHSFQVVQNDHPYSVTKSNLVGNNNRNKIKDTYSSLSFSQIDTKRTSGKPEIIVLSQDICGIEAESELSVASCIGNDDCLEETNENEDQKSNLIYENVKGSDIPVVVKRIKENSLSLEPGVRKAENLIISSSKRNEVISRKNVIKSEKKYSSQAQNYHISSMDRVKKEKVEGDVNELHNNISSSDNMGKESICSSVNNNSSVNLLNNGDVLLEGVVSKIQKKLAEENDDFSFKQSMSCVGNTCDEKFSVSMLRKNLQNKISSCQTPDFSEGDCSTVSSSIPIQNHVKTESESSYLLDDSSSGCSDASQLADVKSFRKRSKGSELEKLYESLREIPWAQDWSPTGIVMKRSIIRRSGRLSGTDLKAHSRCSTPAGSSLFRRVQPSRQKIIQSGGRNQKKQHVLKHKSTKSFCRDCHLCTISHHKHPTSFLNKNKSSFMKVLTPVKQKVCKNQTTFDRKNEIKVFNKKKKKPKKEKKLEEIKNAANISVSKVSELKNIKDFSGKNMTKCLKQKLTRESKEKVPEKKIINETTLGNAQKEKCYNDQTLNNMKSSSNKTYRTDTSLHKKLSIKPTSLKSSESGSKHRKKKNISRLKQKKDDRNTLTEVAKEKGSLLRVALHPLDRVHLCANQDGGEGPSSFLKNLYVSQQETSLKADIYKKIHTAWNDLDKISCKHGVPTVSGYLTHPTGKPISSMLREVQESIVDSIEEDKISKRKKALEEDNLRLSKRQSECAFRYREIAVKKHHNYIQIILVPNTIRKNALNLECLRELKEAVIAARKDPGCKVLLINSYGSIFCSGLDLAVLVGLQKKQIAEELALAVKDLLFTLACFPKPLVAAVNGLTVGLGVTLLTYCDVVFASDKAVFYMPYCKLGYVPEGAATLTLPQVVGSTVASDMLLRGCRATALQAQSFGLVSEVIWPTRLMEEAIPHVQAMAANHSQHKCKNGSIKKLDETTHFLCRKKKTSTAINWIDCSIDLGIFLNFFV
ncbi:uncharacterized protein LOC106468559 isoform X2 [Limulus polyphemus]|uniref:Uncharacterized protein LOC106468559 isoform X2 n=1 Tax=Limulus polyphemus TaxID=6850 RepID=A0ABM1T9P4_LIMPO|nr:uncharacterized protein LOC106468559 isoform X2 [Limulus polyphemus]